MKVQNYSKQREIIRNYLKSVTTHPTAEEVYNALRVENPNLSLGTVYRNLNLLVDNNEAIKLNKNNVVRYDGNISEHYHFTCNSCGCIQDIHVDKSNDINSLVSSLVDGSVESHDINFNGVCSKCA